MVIYLTPSRNQVDATFGTVIQGVVPIQADRDAAFERRLEDHYLDLLRLAVLLARNLAEAQDALQTALERAWRSREQLREEDRLDPWLKRIPRLGRVLRPSRWAGTPQGSRSRSMASP
jgi:hypothetical protein